MKWIDYEKDKIDGLCFKTHHHRMKSDIKKFGDEEKESEMKEIRNLSIKNNYFGELEHEKMTEEKKNKELPLLMFIMMKLN